MVRLFSPGLLHVRRWFLIIGAASRWAVLTVTARGDEGEQAESADDRVRQDEEYLEAAISGGNSTLGNHNSDMSATLGPEDFVALFLLLLGMAFISLRHAKYRCSRRKFKQGLQKDPRKHQSR